MTFILNAKGIVTHAFPRVDVWKHPAEVLALIPAPSGGVAAAAVEPSPAAAQAQVSAPATNATAVSPASIGHSAGPDLVAEAARAVLKLLLMHKQSGGTIPPDVSELLSQFGRQN